MILLKHMVQALMFLTICIILNASLIGMELSDSDLEKQNYQDTFIAITQQLCTSCWFGNASKVEQLILDGALINGFHNNQTPLMHALAFCDIAKLKILLKYNANPNLPNKDNFYPLDMLFSSRRCTEETKLDTLKILLNHRLIITNRVETIQKALNQGLTLIAQFLKEAPAFEP